MSWSDGALPGMAYLIPGYGIVVFPGDIESKPEWKYLGRPVIIGGAMGFVPWVRRPELPRCTAISTNTVQSEPAEVSTAVVSSTPPPGIEEPPAVSHEQKIIAALKVQFADPARAAALSEILRWIGTAPGSKVITPYRRFLNVDIPGNIHRAINQIIRPRTVGGRPSKWIIHTSTDAVDFKECLYTYHSEILAAFQVAAAC